MTITRVDVVNNVQYRSNNDHVFGQSSSVFVKLITLLKKHQDTKTSKISEANLTIMKLCLFLVRVAHLRSKTLISLW